MQQAYVLTFRNADGETVGDPITETKSYLNFHETIESVCKTFKTITSWSIDGRPIRPEEKS